MSLWSWIRNLFDEHPGSSAGNDQRAPIALVLFLSQPRDLDAAIIARRASKALDSRITSGDPAATENFVTGDAPSFVLKYGDYVFLINTFDRPYMEDPESAASTIGELRLRKAVNEHCAWLSVDLLGNVHSEQLPEVYRLIGRLAAALVHDDESLAVFAPATGQLNLYDSKTRRILCGNDPFELFDVSCHPPVVPVSGNDPRLKAAVARARAEFDIFVTAFEERRSDQTFSIKARIGDDEVSEYMWVSVTGMENGWIYGRLDNDPVELLSIRCGDRVRVHFDQLNDWLFTDGDEVEGGFTIDVLRRIQEEI